MTRTHLLLCAITMLAGLALPGAMPASAQKAPSMSVPNISPTRPDLNMRAPNALRDSDRTSVSPRDVASSPRDAASKKNNKKAQKAGREPAGPGAGPHLASRPSGEWWSHDLTGKQKAAARTVASRLMPRIDTLLEHPDWANVTLNAVIAELTATGVYRDPRKGSDAGFRSDPGLAAASEADAVRGEASDVQARHNGVSASTAAAAAVLASLPPFGAIVAAQLKLIAEVVAQLGQVARERDSEQAAAKERAEAGSAGEKPAKLRALLSELQARAKTGRDDSLVRRN